MSGWLDIVNKFLEKTPLFPAGALSALTILILRRLGHLSDLNDPASWVIMAGIFCAWVTLALWLHSPLARAGNAVGAKIERWRNKAAEIRKLDIVTDDQGYYLAYLKAKEMREFQAWDLGDTIVALVRMGLLREHEATGRHFAHYEVPRHVWNHMLVPADLKEVSPISIRGTQNFKVAGSEGQERCGPTGHMMITSSGPRLS